MPWPARCGSPRKRRRTRICEPRSTAHRSTSCSPTTSPASRGPGRSHAVRLAQEGADIIAVDIAQEIPTIKGFSPPPTEAELAETVSMVEALDRRIVSAKVDVRDYDGLKSALDNGVAELGHV